MLRTITATALLAAALALPSGALAMNGPAGGTSNSSPAPVNLLRDGKYLPTATAATVQVVRIVRPGGFDFRAAGIGAAVGALVLAVIGGVAIVLSRDGGTTRATGTTAG
jgi:hypothetical protein